MNWKRYDLSVALAFVAFLVLSTNTALAKSVTFQREYTYQASEADSKLSCRAIALEQVKRLLLEELGTYLEAETEVRNYQLTKDQITTLTAGIVQTEVVDEKWDGEKYWLKAKIAADPDKVAQSLDDLRKDRKKSKELEEVRNKAEQASREIERLKKEVVLLKGKLDTRKLRKYNEAINELSATDWFERGLAFGTSGNYKDAIKAFTMVINLDPRSAEAYHNRGNSYGGKGQYGRAIADYNKALELDPRYAGTYNNRGLVYQDKGQYDRAIADYNKALELDPRYAGTYYNRGLVYQDKGQYDRAIADYNKALELDPRSVDAYNNLSWLLATCPNAELRDGKRALKLARKLLELTQGREDYLNLDTLAAALAESGEFENAVKVQQQAISLLNEKGGSYLESYLEDYLKRLKSYKAGKPWRE